jgi:hypothetical protein
VLTLVFAVLVMAIAAAVVSAPLLLHRLEPYLMPAPAHAERSAADRILEALSELEQSQLSGKVAAADYAAQREALERDYLQAIERSA